MKLGLSNWRPRHLLAAWVTYWIAAVCWTLGPTLLKVWQITRRSDIKSSASVSLGNEGLHIDISQAATSVWSVSASVGEIVALVTVPPLLLWVAWLLLRPKRGAPRAADLLSPPAGAAPDFTMREKVSSPRSDSRPDGPNG
jgi:hypothetical protein